MAQQVPFPFPVELALACDGDLQLDAAALVEVLAADDFESPELNGLQQHMDFPVLWCGRRTVRV